MIRITKKSLLAHVDQLNARIMKAECELCYLSDLVKELTGNLRRAEKILRRINSAACDAEKLHEPIPF